MASPSTTDAHMRDVEQEVTNGFINPNDLSLSDEKAVTDGYSDRAEIRIVLDLEDIGASDDGSVADDGVVPAAAPRMLALKPTGCCYDERMTWHANPDYDNNSPHPEQPDRIRVIMRGFRKSGIVFSGSDAELANILLYSPTRYMARIPTRYAGKAEIQLVHMADQYDWVLNTERWPVADLHKWNKEHEDLRSLYIGPLTARAALLAASGAIDTCRHVVEGNVKNAIAVIRPPGHHAETDESMGFCVFNNVPIAARVCQREYPKKCKKVLILDWDVHHGNGTQNMFYGDDTVLYISIHVYAGGTFYPCSPDRTKYPRRWDGAIENVGEDSGAGKNVNIGWETQGMGDGEYMAAFQRIVLPIAQEFGPDLVIISAGFDAADGDELGGCFVTAACYAHMTHMLMSLAEGRVAVCLEGGYSLPAIERSALAVGKTLMGEPPPQFNIPPVSNSATRVLNRVMEVHAPYWNCMREARGMQEPFEILDKDAVSMSEMIRSYQSHKLADGHNMTNLSVLRDNAYKPFENQVLVTPSVNAAKKIIVILHDPPEVQGLREATKPVQPQSTFVSDHVKKYIDWAVKNDFGVIDINIPVPVSTSIDPNHPSTMPALEAELSADLTASLKELVEYLWDNYLELYASDNIIFVGIGNSYYGANILLSTRDCKHRIAGVLDFVKGMLRPIKSETDESLAKWYRDHAYIYLSHNHAVWRDEELQKKTRRRRFGQLHRSSERAIDKMMVAHFEEATRWILEMADEQDTKNAQVEYRSA